MRITSKGQVTIPAHIREQAGFMPNTEVEFVLEGEAVRLVKVRSRTRETRGQRAVRLLSGSATRELGMSTDELVKLLRDE
jgi:AbrB family looped-hinge helix DNA binding protein